MFNHTVYDKMREYLAELDATLDREVNLIGNQNRDVYTPEYLEDHFGELGENWLHSYVESIAYASFLFCVENDAEKANRILDSALPNIQVTDEDSENFGALYWFMEEKHIRDHNGNFFNGSMLLQIYTMEREWLSETNTIRIKKLLREMYPLFVKERAKTVLSYVNPSLGKYSMCFLLAELFELPSMGDDKRLFIEYVDFLRKNGVNEAFSPVYYTVDIIILYMVDALTADNEIKCVSTDLLQDVFLKETAFFGALFSAPFRRGYNEEYSVYRKDLLPLLLGYSEEVFAPIRTGTYTHMMLASIFLRKDGKFDEIAKIPVCDEIPRELKVRIHQDCEGTSFLSDNFLLGSINDYPPETSMWQTVGIGGNGWQDGPVCFTIRDASRTAGVLRLEAVDENGELRTHPYSGAYNIEKSKYIYPFISFPPEPRLRCLQHRDQMLCLYKIDKVDGILKLLGFNMFFARFSGRVYDFDGKIIELVSEEPRVAERVIVEFPSVWLIFIPLSRVDMAKSSLLTCAFTPPSVELRMSRNALSCSMYNYDGKEPKRFVQNHISGGFFQTLVEKKVCETLADIVDYASAIKINEEWRSDRINAHVDKRDSIRNVSAKCGGGELMLEWDHFSG
ncbi:MAG: hypothetical protein KAG97_04415, partial [Victivallales bacterium]|nr:hypothetical protein [Victivallales bacterium]